MSTVDKILFVYSPTITGTIFSLEHHAHTHPHIHKWTQEAIPSTNGGWITFYDHQHEIVSRYPTVRSKGVYFIQDMKFVPSAPTVTTAQPSALPASPQDSDTPARISTLLVDLPNDFSHSDAFDGFLEYMKVPDSARLSQLDVSPPLPPTPALSPALTAILQFEIWH